MLRALPIVAIFAFTLYALIDLAQTKRGTEAHLSRGLWITLIVLIPIAGAAGWLLVGKTREDEPRTPARRPLAPDDDPAFLAQLDKLTGRSHKPDPTDPQAPRDVDPAAPKDGSSDKDPTDKDS